MEQRGVDTTRAASLAIAQQRAACIALWMIWRCGTTFSCTTPSYLFDADLGLVIEGHMPVAVSAMPLCGDMVQRNDVIVAITDIPSGELHQTVDQWH